LVVLKEQVRKAQLIAMSKDLETTKLLVNMELTLLDEINRVSRLEKLRGSNVGITEIDTHA
jgi:hypothetical protein